MTMTDPIADMLTRLRNANSAYHDTVAMPFSKLKSHIAEILQAEGYIASWTSRSRPTRWARSSSSSSSTARTASARSPASAACRKPGLRVYAKSTNLPKVLGGLGVAILSTSSGLLTDRQAAKKGVGGEVLAYVW